MSLRDAIIVGTGLLLLAWVFVWAFCAIAGISGRDHDKVLSKEWAKRHRGKHTVDNS